MALTRRRLLFGGLTAAAGVSGLAAAGLLARRNGLLPPSYHSPYALGEILDYASQRLLMARHPLAREFSLAEVSKFTPVKGRPPQSDDYLRLASSAFSDWRLELAGLVASPASFTLADLVKCPTSSQITLHACEEGWSYIAHWSGVSLAWLLGQAGIAARARYVVFYCHDGWWGSLDMEDALHPQTLLALALNGKQLSIEHGAPLRLRVPRQMGYKSFKWVYRIAVVDSLKDIGHGRPDLSTNYGYSWYAGI